MEHNDKNSVHLAGTVIWIGDRVLRAGQPPSQQYGLECVRRRSNGNGEMRGETVRVPVLVSGEPMAVRRGDRLFVRGHLAWHVDERNGLKMGFHVVAAEEVRIIDRLDRSQNPSERHGQRDGGDQAVRGDRRLRPRAGHLHNQPRQ